jgi:pyochelin synthetase
MREVQGLATALEKATIWAADAALMVQVLDEIGGRAIDLPKRVRHCLARGDRLTTELAASLTARLAGADTHLSLMSGASGTALWSSVAGFVVDAEAPLTLYPIGNMRLHIVDADGRACPPGVVGNLHIAGAGLALGHVNGAEFSTGCFRVDEHLGERLYPTELPARSATDGAIELVGMANVAAGGLLQQAKVEMPTPTTSTV